MTALAELTPSLKSAVAESGVRHTWCNVRDVEEANIKAHFGTAFEVIEACRQKGEAVFVHCSRGVSRSASHARSAVANWCNDMIPEECEFVVLLDSTVERTFENTK